MAESTTVSRHELEGVIEESGVDASVRTYSGRYMFGEACAGVVVHTEDIPTLMIRLGGALGDGSLSLVGSDGEVLDGTEATQRLSFSRQDDMGKRKVVYWPLIMLDERN